MRIVRGPATKADFTVLPNATLRDASLSYRARGVLAYLLSHVDGWSTTSDDLARLGREGRDAIRTALAELQRAGYLERTRTQDQTTGLWSTTVVIHEAPTTGFQASDNQPSGNQPSVSQALSRKTIKKIPQPPQQAAGASCPRHTTAPGASCRACGTSPRQIADQVGRDAAERRRVAEQERLRLEAEQRDQATADVETRRAALAQARAALRSDAR